MNFFIFFYIFLALIYSAFSIIPIWNLKSSSIDLTPQNSDKNIIIYENQYTGLHARLTKTITKGTNNLIDKNYLLMVDGEIENNVTWDGVESSYFIKGIGHFVCPTGKNFINHYKNRVLFEIKPYDFNCNDDSCNWELICYFQSKASSWMFQGFLNSDKEINLYGKKLTGFDSNENEKKNWKNLGTIKGLFDFLWTYEFQSSQKYNMYALYLENNIIYLKKRVIQITDSDSYEQNEGSTPIIIDYKSTYTHAYFNHSISLFYWMTCNNTDNFRSGYSTQEIDVSNDYSSISLVINQDSPFLFLNEITLNKLDMIRNTRFVYYEVLYSSKDNIIYRGIIDIELNHIIFNTNENILKYKPLTNHSMFVLTEKNAYEVCLIKDNNICIERCPSGKSLVLKEEGNYCSNNCPYKSKRNEKVCFEKCNSTYFEIENNYCGLCKDLNPSKPYKIINQNGCYDEQQDYTYVFNEKLKLLDKCPDHCIKCGSKNTCESCENGYKKEGNECKEELNCYSTCNRCTKSGDAEHHNCIACKKNLYFYNETGEGNCLENCPDSFYKGDKVCLKCHKDCLKCTTGPENEEGEEENQNCDSCNDITKYLIKAEGFNKNCVDICPNGTITVNDTKGNYCKLRKEEEKEEKRNDILILNIYMIIFGIFLVIFSICIYIQVCRNKKDAYELINEINTELQSKNSKLVEDV